MYRCTPNGITFTFMPCLNLGSKGYNCFCKVITTSMQVIPSRVLPTVLRSSNTATQLRYIAV